MMEQLLKYHSRIAVIALIFIFISGCRKDNHTFYFTGKTKGLLVTEHNINIDATSNGSPVSEDVEIDVDKDDVMDFRFISLEDSIYGVYKNTYRKIEVETVNQFFYLNKIEGINKKYFHVGPPNYDFYGMFPRSTKHVDVNSDSTNSTYYEPTLDYVKTLGAGSQIMQNFNWGNNTYPINLFQAQYNSGYYYFNTVGDSLWGHMFHYAAFPQNFVQDELIYLPFKLEAGLEDRYGWIEIKVTQGDNLTILRSAISTK